MSRYIERRVRNLLTEVGEGAAAPTCHVREISNVKVNFVNEICLVSSPRSRCFDPRTQFRAVVGKAISFGLHSSFFTGGSFWYQSLVHTVQTLSHAVHSVERLNDTCVLVMYNDKNK